ncbi:hypothetical protein RIF29_27104 [Crotalaria pallida]|uniref:Pentatricopeptide repeat protein n=1 Tax=Crotalaria pallida TaxID=3830 RepID=A0AAN9EQT6_CROPI
MRSSSTAPENPQQQEESLRHRDTTNRLISKAVYGGARSLSREFVSMGGYATITHHATTFTFMWRNLEEPHRSTLSSSQGFAPDKYSFDRLLSGLCAAGRIDEAVNVYRDVVRTYHDTDARIHTVITGRLVKVGKYGRAASIFRLAVTEKRPLDSVAYTVGICAHLRGGRTQEACALYYRLKDNGMKPSVHTCNMMLFTLCKEKDLQMVKEMLQDMIDSRMELSDGKFLNFCKFPCRSEDYLSLFSLLAKMRDLGLLSAKALYALSFDGHAECVQEKYNHHPEAIT